MNSTTFRSTVSLGNGINTLECCQFTRHRHTTSLHGDLGHVIFGQDIHAVIEYLCNHGLLSKEKDCNKCGSPVRIDGMERLKDKTVFRCRDKRCKNTRFWRGGSFFANSNFPPDKWLHVIYLWSVSTPVTSACTQVGISRVTDVDIYIKLSSRSL